MMARIAVVHLATLSAIAAAEHAAVVLPEASLRGAPRPGAVSEMAKTDSLVDPLQVL